MGMSHNTKQLQRKLKASQQGQWAMFESHSAFCRITNSDPDWVQLELTGFSLTVCKSSAASPSVLFCLFKRTLNLRSSLTHHTVWRTNTYSHTHAAQRESDLWATGFNDIGSFIFLPSEDMSAQICVITADKTTSWGLICWSIIHNRVIVDFISQLFLPFLCPCFAV